MILPVQVRVVPDYFSLASIGRRSRDFGGLPMINLRDPALNDVQRLVKRIFDLALSGILTAIAFIPMAIITLLIVGLRRPPSCFASNWAKRPLFSMYKFRSMVEGAGQNIRLDGGNLGTAASSSRRPMIPA